MLKIIESPNVLSSRKIKCNGKVFRFNIDSDVWKQAKKHEKLIKLYKS